MEYQQAEQSLSREDRGKAQEYSAIQENNSDSQGDVWISYNSPDYIKELHGLPQELLQNIDIIETLAAKAGA